METNSSLSLKTRRTLVIIFFITLMTPFLIFFLLGEKMLEIPNLLLIPLVLVIINGLIAYYLKSKSEIFNIANSDSNLDERQSFIRVKAQRDAYQFILTMTTLILASGYELFKNDRWASNVYLLSLMILLYIYLPTMLIAWNEKEV